MDKGLIKEIFSPDFLALSDFQVSQFALYGEELLNWNKKFNLTAITAEKEIIIKHFYDSALGLKAWRFQGNETVLDLGTGAGFPGLPLKIINPALEITLVDSLQKRVGFLREMIKLLGLNGAEAIHGRAEELGQNQAFREKYDLVVSRAVAGLAVLVEYCLPLVKPGGVMLAYKGADAEQEIEAARKAVAILGGEIAEMETFALPLEMGKRSIILLKKVKQTPGAYPRKPGLPGKKPLY
ncbi:MAG: 16S rRNA (guanine(527)-N(7))-methyltransferase RsmG [Peptococcia bacterium]|jgi:16S rRNA (guanine527-N7)-methyltransferase